MKVERNLAIIVLAAGKSSRLGQIKQLVTLHGQPILSKQCQLALSITPEVFCVLGCNASEVSKAIEHTSVNMVINDNWQKGVSSSIRAGIAALPEKIDAVMILLADQWQLELSELQLMVQHWQDKPECIVIAEEIIGKKEAPQKGPPVIFPRKFWEEISTLKGDVGAKPMIQKYKSWVETHELASAFIDLDTPEDLHKLRKYEKSSGI